MSSLSGTSFDADLPEERAVRPNDSAAGPRRVDDSTLEAEMQAEQRLREAAWLRQAQAGDRAAFGQLVLVYQDRLYNAVLRMIGDAEEARDITQEAFTRGLMKIDAFRGEASPYTWFFRIAMNLAITQWRKQRHRRTFSLDASLARGKAARSEDGGSTLLDRLQQPAGADGASPLAEMEKRERQQQVLTALGRIDAEHRAVLVMRDIEGFDYQQMADVLDMPLGTLKSRLFRARLALREELKKVL